MRIFDSNSKIVDSELKAFPKLRALVIKAVKLNLLEAAYATGTNFNFNPFSPEGQCLLEHIGGITAQLSLEIGMPSFRASCLEDVDYLARLPDQDSVRFDYLLATHRKNLLTASIALRQEFDDLKNDAGDDSIKASRIDFIHRLFLEHKLIKNVFFILPEISSPLYKELNKIYLHLKKFFLGTSGLLDKINRYLNGEIKEIDPKACLDAIYSGLFTGSLRFLYNSPENIPPFWEDGKTLAQFKKVKDRGLSLILTLNENIPKAFGF